MMMLPVAGGTKTFPGSGEFPKSFPYSDGAAEEDPRRQGLQ